jgi:hypothetical protein
MLYCQRHNKECTIRDGVIKHGTPGFYSGRCDSPWFTQTRHLTPEEVLEDAQAGQADGDR